MPRQTFFNLPEDKRRLVVDLAAEEFAANTYYRASLSRIVERAGIAKGSMYQYFEDKFDVYLYLLDQLGERKMAIVNEAVEALGPGAGMFEKLGASLRATLRLAHEHPLLFAVGSNLMRETDQALVTRVLEHFKPTSETVIFDWFASAVEKGEIDKSLAPATATYVFSAINLQVSQDIAAGRLTLEGAEPFLAQVFTILKRGMQPRWAGLVNVDYPEKKGGLAHDH